MDAVWPGSRSRGRRVSVIVLRSLSHERSAERIPRVMKHYSPLLLALSVSCTNGCGAKAVEEPPAKPRGQSGRVTLTKEQVLAAKLAIQPVEEREMGETVNTSGKVAFDDL